MSQLTFIRDVIYSLKRDYGESIKIGREANSSNLETGVVTPSKTEITISRAIVLPKLQNYEILQALGLYKGGALEKGTTEVFIDKRDLASFNLELDCYLIYSGQMFQFSDFSDFKYAFVIKAKETKGKALP